MAIPGTQEKARKRQRSLKKTKISSTTKRRKTLAKALQVRKLKKGQQKGSFFSEIEKEGVD